METETEYERQKLGCVDCDAEFTMRKFRKNNNSCPECEGTKVVGV